MLLSNDSINGDNMTFNDALYNEENIRSTLNDVYGANGLFSKYKEDYKVRPQQIKMSEFVAKAIKEPQNLVIEAGTGTGKTFGYLVPAILYAIQNDGQVIISTYSKTLQDQILKKDIKTLEKVFNTTLKASVLKGVNNYVCVKKFFNAQDEYIKYSSSIDYRDSTEKNNVFDFRNALDYFAKNMIDGDVACVGELGDLSNFFKKRNVKNYEDFVKNISTTTEKCLKKNCPFAEKCFYQKAKEKVKKSNIVILNHSIFALGTVHDADFISNKVKLVVFDEAHKFVDVVRTTFTKEINSLSTIENVLLFLEESPFYSHYLEVVQDSFIENIEKSSDSSLSFKTKISKFKKKKRNSKSKAKLNKSGYQEIFDFDDEQSFFYNSLVEILEARINIENSIDAIMEHMEVKPSAKSKQGNSSNSYYKKYKIPDNQIEEDFISSLDFEKIQKDVESLLRGLKNCRDGLIKCEKLVESREKTLFQADDKSSKANKNTKKYHDFIVDTVISATNSVKELLLNFYIMNLPDDMIQGFVIDINEKKLRPTEDPRLKLVYSLLDFDINNPETYRHNTAELDSSKYYFTYGRDGFTNCFYFKEIPFNPRVEFNKYILESNKFEDVSFLYTSATLAVDLKSFDDNSNPLDSYSEKLGIIGDYISDQNRDYVTLNLESPFNYRENTQILCPCRFVEGFEGKEWPIQNCVVYIEAFANQIKGGIFFLVTSKKDIDEAESLLKKSSCVTSGKRKLYVQKDNVDINTLVEAFKNDGNGILIGTKSFWEGVDIPGKALSLVCISKLPFPTPDITIRAENELYKRLGKNGFLLASVYRMIIDLKQGVGRLIRSESDIGGIVLFDPRASSAHKSKSFRKYVENNLPNIPYIESPDVFVEFLKRKNLWIG
jgi:Rad3-related DNA helicase